MELPRFNIRVYGLLLDNDQLLVSDEIRMGIKMTKMPGGGLTFSEGLAGCLKREFIEELEAEIEVGSIFYVNPFLQISAFRANDEVIAVYFWVTRTSELKGRFSTIHWDFPTDDDEQQVFRWVPMHALDPDQFTFLIDQAMIRELIKWWDAQKLA